MGKINGIETTKRTLNDDLVLVVLKKRMFVPRGRVGWKLSTWEGFVCLDTGGTHSAVSVASTLKVVNK